MFCRWIIRSFFLGLFLFCMAGWLVSYIGNPSITYATKHQYLWVEPIGGSLCAGCTSESFEQEMVPGFHFYVVDPSGEYSEDFIKTFPHALGLYGGIQTFTWGSAWMVGLPFWFLTPVFAWIAFLAWRKTAKPNPATAFPVETVKK